MTDEAKVIAYTSPAYSYEVGFYNAHQCSLIIPTTTAIYVAKSCRFCLFNHTRLTDSISHHITPLDIHSLGGDTHTYTCHRQNLFLEIRCMLAMGQLTHSLKNL